MRSKEKISKIDVFLLGLLAERPMYGYQINELIEEWDIRLWARISFSAIYYALNKLAKRGLVNKVASHKAPVTQYVYYITEKGRKVLRQRLLEELASRESAYLEYNIGLSFINHLSPEEVIGALKQRLEYVEYMIGRVKHHLKKWPPEDRYLAPLSHGLAYYESEKRWLEEFIEYLSQKAGTPGTKS